MSAQYIETRNDFGYPVLVTKLEVAKKIAADACRRNFGHSSCPRCAKEEKLEAVQRLLRPRSAL